MLTKLTYYLRKPLQLIVFWMVEVFKKHIAALNLHIDGQYLNSM